MDLRKGESVDFFAMGEAKGLAATSRSLAPSKFIWNMSNSELNTAECTLRRLATGLPKLPLSKLRTPSLRFRGLDLTGKFVSVVGAKNSGLGRANSNLIGPSSKPNREPGVLA